MVSASFELKLAERELLIFLFVKKLSVYSYEKELSFPYLITTAFQYYVH